MPDPPKLYWDASVFLSYINENTQRLPDIEVFLEHAEKHRVQIVTSALSVVEVAFGQEEQANKVLDPAVEARIDALWNASDSPVGLVEFYPLLADETRKLIREALARGIAVPKPADAMHMATAKHIGATEVHTYDPTWKKYEAFLELKIGPPRTPFLQFDLFGPGAPSRPWELVEAWPALPDLHAEATPTSVA